MGKLDQTSNINSLITGYHTFKTEHAMQKELYEQLIEHGQQPKALMIACCDSRVDPAIVTHCEPGELFMVRNVANLVPPFDVDPRHHGTSAALEFAVVGLEIKDIIVFGHRYCGGIRALMQSDESSNGSNFIRTWMNIAKPAKQQVLADYPQSSLDEQAHHCEKASLIISLNNLKTFPWIKARVAEGELTLHGWYFDLKTGQIQRYNENTQSFEELK